MKLYVGQQHELDLTLPLQPQPFSARSEKYASTIVGLGTIRKAKFYGDSLDGVIKAALKVCVQEREITIVREEPRSKHKNNMLRIEGYRKVSDAEFVEVISATKRISKEFYRGSNQIITVAT